MEVIDNSVDEIAAGHGSTIHITLHVDGSVEVSDDGRGMPVDMHPEEKISGVELILTRLHAGAKFSNKSYEFSGGLAWCGGLGCQCFVTKVTSQCEPREARHMK